MKDNFPILVFDVESIGLHGEGFAVAAQVSDANRKVIREIFYFCPPDSAKGKDASRDWVEENCKPYSWLEPNPKFPSPVIFAYPKQVRKAFWEFWGQMRKEYPEIQMVADVAWPVEARFLAACIEDDLNAREWEGPFPLLDVSTLRFLSDTFGQQHQRLPSELPLHHPLADVRYSARQFKDLLNSRSIL